MHKRQRSLKSKVFEVLNSESLYTACGFPGQKLSTNLWADASILHNQPADGFAPVHKPGQEASVFAHIALFLYTVFQQCYTIFQSVMGSFVHIIHRAYIYESNAKKGMYI